MITLKNNMHSVLETSKRLKKDSSMSSSVHNSSFKDKSKIPSIPTDNNSYNFNNFEKPLISNLAFKGFSLSGITKEFTHLSKEPLVFEESFIKSAKEIYGKALDGKTLDNALNFFKKEGKSTIEIERNTLLAELIDNILYPVKDFPKDIANFVIDTVPGIKNNENLKKTLRPEGSGLDNHLKKAEKEKNMASLTGLFHKIEKLSAKDDNKIIESLRKDGHKEADPLKGNYNTSAERFMARWVSGMMSAIFLATDTYNLTRLVKDDHKNANNERKSRFAQEVGRVGFAAYLTLVLTGTFKKASNKAIGNALFLTGLATITAEVIGRKIAGKDIMPISKEKAIKLANEENKGIKAEPKMSAVAFNNANVSVSTQSTAQQQNVFDKIHKPAQKVAFTSSEKVETKQENKKSSNKWLKILAGYAGLSAAAIVLHNSKTFKGILEATTGDLKKAYSKFYAKVTNSAEHIKKEQFESFINEIKADKNSGLAGLAADYEKGVGDYRAKLVKSGAKLDENIVYLGNSTNYKTKGFMDSGVAFPFRFIKKTFLLPETLGKFAVKWAKITFANPEELIKATAIKDETFKELIQDQLSRKQLVEVNKKVAEFVKQEHANKPEIIKLLKDIPTSNFELNKALKEVKKALTEDEKTKIDEQFHQFSLSQISKNKQNKAILEKAAKEATSEEDAIKKLKDSGHYGLYKKLVQQKEAALSELEKLGLKEQYLDKKTKDAAKEILKNNGNTELAKTLESLEQIDVKDINTLNESLDRVQKGFKSFQKIKDNAKNANKGATDAEILEKARTQFSKKNLNSFDSTNVSSYDSSQLGTLTKFLCSGITGFFLVSDSFNLVMQKSKGENKDLSKQKAKERAVQEVSRNLFSTYFVKGFNDVFKVLYNQTLLGAAMITATNVFLYEIATRKAVGLPITGKSKNEILDKERENLNQKGFWGKYYRAMSYLTGKSSLSSRIKKPQSIEQQPKLELAAFMANCKKKVS